MDKKQKIIFAIETAVILSFLLFIGSGIVVSPFYGEINMIDEGQLGAWIRHMLSGELLYKDIYSAYGPLYVFPAYLLAKVFGPSVFLVRIVYILFNTFLAVLITRLVLTKLGIRYIFIVLIVISLLIVPGLGMRQGMGLFAILLGYTAFEKKNLIFSIFAGICVSLSYLLSSEVGIFTTSIFAVLFAFHLISENKIMTAFKKIALIVGSTCLTFFIFYLWSVQEGWFWSYVYSITSDMTIYSGVALPNGKSFPNALELIPHSYSLITWVRFIVSKELLLYWLFFLYIVNFLYLFVKTLIRKSEKRDLLIFLIALYGFCLSTILIGRYGHFAFTLVPAFILLGYFSDVLLGNFKSSVKLSSKIYSAFLIVMICLFMLRIALIYRPHFTKAFLIPQAIVSYESSPSYVGRTVIPPFQAREIKMMQKFIAENTYSSENVFFLSNEPMMYLLTDRGNPTRYDIPAVANTKAKRLEVLNDIINDKTKYVVYNNNAWPIDEINNFARIPELSDYLKENYNRSNLENFIIFTKKNN